MLTQMPSGLHTSRSTTPVPSQPPRRRNRLILLKLMARRTPPRVNLEVAAPWHVSPFIAVTAIPGAVLATK